MLCSYHRERERERRKPEGVAYVYHIDCGDGVTGVYICLDFSNCTH